eukprot:CAMPEP_0172430520 /NCGR_PEP_ID=MMETSP1064-20121228/54785_1 /TAXON_ID=202472 /ORGANISM="Aulacoseira subarctica , Strain CCAP 1002/5" /LENGTH=415 /DNA_ID=CAMNT_0013176629 /DNA_START=65 /DNA_END=1313 /DNA_ORIENTATION=-
MIMLTTIEQSYALPPGSTVHLVCDNEAATKIVRKIVQSRRFVLDPQQTDVDILLEIQGEFLLSQIKYEVIWIRSHQDDHEAVASLPFLARLNVDCDRRAKLYLRNNRDILPPPVVLSQERWGAICRGQKVTSQLKQVIYENYTAPASRAYLLKRFAWTDLCLPWVNWRSMHYSKSKLTMPRNTFVSKILYDKLPVAERLHFFDSSESPVCRSCNTSVETQQHLFQCSFKESRRQRLRSWSKHLKVLLTTGHTSRIIMDVIDGNVCAYLRLPPRPCLWQHGPGNRTVYAATQRAVAANPSLVEIKFSKVLYLLAGNSPRSYIGRLVVIIHIVCPGLGLKVCFPLFGTVPMICGFIEMNYGMGLLLWIKLRNLGRGLKHSSLIVVPIGLIWMTATTGFLGCLWKLGLRREIAPYKSG